MVVSRDQMSRVSTLFAGSGSTKSVRTSWGVTLVAGHGQWGMAQTTPAMWRKAFCQRTAALRISRGWTQAQMASALGISLDRYKKYEIRTPLPQMLLPRFALLVDRELGDLFALDKPAARGRQHKRAS